MTHAEILAEDITSYVENYYPTMLSALEAQHVSLATTIAHVLEAQPPGRVMSDEYRADFLQTFAYAYVNILGPQ